MKKQLIAARSHTRTPLQLALCRWWQCCCCRGRRRGGRVRQEKESGRGVFFMVIGFGLFTGVFFLSKTPRYEIDNLRYCEVLGIGATSKRKMLFSDGRDHEKIDRRS